MLKFNTKFNEPLRERVIESATRVVNYRQYLYKNETLVDFLELDYELCERLGLQSIYKTKTRQEIEKEKYQKKLKAEGKISEKEKISQRRAKIKDLLVKGLCQKEIYASLNISKRTCINDIKYLKEQGLI
jgi:DNA-binding NarL/FixJ family response regulator